MHHLNEPATFSTAVISLMPDKIEGDAFVRNDIFLIVYVTAARRSTKCNIIGKPTAGIKCVLSTNNETIKYVIEPGRAAMVNNVARLSRLSSKGFSFR